jgi:hypothetical protein
MLHIGSYDQNSKLEMAHVGSSIRWQKGDEEAANSVSAMPGRSADLPADKEAKKQLIRRNSRSVIDPATVIPIEYRSV